MAEVVFIHGVGEVPGPGAAAAEQAWVEPLVAPMPEAVDGWLRDRSTLTYYQDWSWYEDRGEADRRSKRSWAVMRALFSDVVDEARAAYDSVEPERVRDLAEVAARWSDSERVLAASNRVAEQVSAFNMWQVTAFLDDLAGSRQHILDRVADSVSSDTRVVVGHSLGSIVAYEAIHALGLRLDALVTLGSPLGTPGLVLDRLRPAPAFPAGVERWVNISHPSEPVAIVHELAPLFPAADASERVEDLVIETDAAYPWHAVDTYLGRDEVRRVLWSALGLREPG